jgi:hypothetical protein
MIEVAKALDGTYSYVARDPKGEIIILGDGCETVDVVRDFFSDLIACATDKKPSRLDVHIKIVSEIPIPGDKVKMNVEGIGGLRDMMLTADGKGEGAIDLVEKVVPESEFQAGEPQTVAKKVKSNKKKGPK